MDKKNTKTSIKHRIKIGNQYVKSIELTNFEDSAEWIDGDIKIEKVKVVESEGE